MIDPATAMTVVNVVGGAALKLGGLGLSCASTVGGWMGFTSAGVVQGSLAAAAQSSVGNVVAGSTFAAIQSAGATGASVVTAAVSAPSIVTVGAGAYGIYRLYRWVR